MLKRRAPLQPLIEAETGVVPLQNGVDASERPIPLIGSQHVLGGIAVVTGSIVAPGVVRQSGKHHGITFGEMDGRITPRAERIRDVCQAAGIQATISNNIQRDRWDKFVGLVAASGICALARQSIGGLRDDPDIAPLFEASMREVVEVGRASGVALGPEVVERWIQFMGDVPPNWTPSMAVALLAGGRLELPWLAGKVVELGRVQNLPTPVNAVIYGTLKPFTDGARHSQAQ
jgi:2-dehydropantoate 2-reductase